jgi:hypothetical protein
MTLKQVIKRIEGIAQAHRQINTFFYGDFAEFVKMEDVVYPALYLEHQDNATISKSDKMTSYKFNFYFFDLLDISVDSNANELEIKSDLSSIAQDIMALLNFSDYQDDWYISKDNNVTFGKFQTPDLTIGVGINITIATRYGEDRCQIPLSGSLPVETDPNTGAGYVPNIYAFTKMKIVVNGLSGSPLVNTSTFQNNVLKNATELYEITVNKQTMYVGEDFTFNATIGTLTFVNYIWNTDDIAILSFNQKIN